MSSDEALSGEASPKPSEKDELPVAELLTGEDLSATQAEVKPWKFDDLESIESQQKDVLRDEVASELRKELKPELVRQTSVIKKEAFLKAQKEGYDVGYREGLEKGRQEAYQKAEQEAETALSAQVKSMQNLLESMSNPYKLISQEVFVSLAKLVSQLAEKVIQDHIRENEDWIITCLEEAVSQLPESESQLIIELNEADIEIVSAYLQMKQHDWVLKANEDIESGQCKVKQGASIVVNDWQDRLSEWMQQFVSRAENGALDHDGTNPSIDSTH